MKSIIIAASLFICAASHADRIDIIILHTSNNGVQVFGGETNSIGALKANPVLAGAKTNLVRIARDARQGIINGEAERLERKLTAQYQPVIDAGLSARKSAIEAVEAAKQDAE